MTAQGQENNPHRILEEIRSDEKIDSEEYRRRLKDLFYWSIEHPNYLALLITITSIFLSIFMYVQNCLHATFFNVSVQEVPTPIIFNELLFSIFLTIPILCTNFVAFFCLSNSPKGLRKKLKALGPLFLGWLVFCFALIIIGSIILTTINNAVSFNDIPVSDIILSLFSESFRLWFMTVFIAFGGGIIFAYCYAHPVKKKQDSNSKPPKKYPFAIHFAFSIVLTLICIPILAFIFTIPNINRPYTIEIAQTLNEDSSTYIVVFSRDNSLCVEECRKDGKTIYVDNSQYKWIEKNEVELERISTGNKIVFEK